MNAGDIQAILVKHMHGTEFGLTYKGQVMGIVRDGSFGTILKFEYLEKIEIPIPQELIGHVTIGELTDLAVSAISVTETPVSQVKNYFSMRELQKLVDIEK